MRRLIATVAAVLLTLVSASNVHANRWRALTLDEAEQVLAKARAFEQAERGRRRVNNNGAPDWYGKLSLVGTDRDRVLARLVETDGERYRVVSTE